MPKRGILWRVLGDDPALWQSPDAWAVVADLCEVEGYGERAERLRDEASLWMVIDPEAPLRWAPMLGAWCGSRVWGLHGAMDTDGAQVTPRWGYEDGGASNPGCSCITRHRRTSEAPG